MPPLPASMSHIHTGRGGRGLPSLSPITNGSPKSSVSQHKYPNYALGNYTTFCTSSAAHRFDALSSLCQKDVYICYCPTNTQNIEAAKTFVWSGSTNVWFYVPTCPRQFYANVLFNSSLLLGRMIVMSDMRMAVIAALTKWKLNDVTVNVILIHFKVLLVVAYLNYY